LNRGARLTEILKQDQYTPYPVEQQVVAVYAGVRGHLDGLELGVITRYEAELLSLVRDKHADVLATIRDEGQISDATEEKLKGIVEAFTKSFA
jgi:F-type H+-transporting ATPase subunit alpha